MGDDNKAFINRNRQLIIDLTIQRLDLLNKGNLEYMSPEQLVWESYCDPTRVFVKDEPHSTKKVQQKRWRLIFGVSLIDQLVERLLCGSQNKTEIANWWTIPSMSGLSLTDDDSLANIYSRAMNFTQKYGTTLAEADVIGFDWSVQPWEIRLDAEARILLGGMSGSAARILRNRAFCFIHSMLTMPCGTLVTPTWPGIQLSGSYNTSSTNSRIRVWIASLAGSRWAFAMGDDCVEEHVEGAHEKYAKLGHKLKMYQERTDSFEFCSHMFTKQGAYPVDGTKSLYKLIEQKTMTRELMHQFAYDLKNSPWLDKFISCAERVKALREEGGRAKLD
jgi:hypothetical protein